jgi:signal transduction histidine kinase
VEPVHPEVLRLTLNQLAQRIALEKKLEEVSKEAERRGKELSESIERRKEVTAEKDLTYRELLLAYSRLQDVNQKKNNFLSMATHELRTPVTVIKGYHRILLDDRLGKLLPEQRKVLMESEENCNRLVKIINSLLNLSRIETGRLELVYQENDFIDNVKVVVEELKEALTRKGLSTVLNLETGIPKFKYDREKITQVLTNLLENSIKYTPENGKIYLSAEPHFWERRNLSNPLIVENKRARPSTPSTGLPIPSNAVKVEVSDTGVGISPQHQQEIFEEFTQVAASQSNKSGLGLGLAISKRIIEAHGGKIWVESQVHVGSKFVFLLPFSPMESPL